MKPSPPIITGAIISTNDRMNIPVNEGQAREFVGIELDHQLEVASRVDFAKTTVRELKDEVLRLKHPQDVVECKLVAKPRPIATNHEVRLASRST